MTITMYDKFALLPKRCDKCNKLFIFEWYNEYKRSVAPNCPPLKIIKCKECIDEGVK